MLSKLKLIGSLFIYFYVYLFWLNVFLYYKTDIIFYIQFSCEENYSIFFAIFLLYYSFKVSNGIW